MTPRQQAERCGARPRPAGTVTDLPATSADHRGPRALLVRFARRSALAVTAVAVLAGLAAAPAHAAPTPAPRSTAPVHAGAVAGYLKVDRANTHQLMTKLTVNAADVSVLVLSDSTGNDDWEWAYLTARHLAATFPRYTVEYRLWDRYSGTYGGATVLARGTGTHVLRFWNGAAPGRSTRTHLGANLVRAITPAHPDHVFLSHGHNEGIDADSGLASSDELRWRGQYLALSESVATLYPRATITVILQNPQREMTRSGRRVAVYRDIAAERGYGVIDVYSAFLLDPNWRGEYMTNNSHPNQAGMVVWAAELKRYLQRGSTTAAMVQLPSPLGRVGAQLLGNCRFDAFDRVPAGWTRAYGAVVAKDTRYKETGRWGVRVQGTGNARLVRTLPGWLHNQWVTVAARVRIPPGAAATAGRVGLVGETSTVVSRDDSREGQGAFTWVIVSNRVGRKPGAVLLYGGATVDRVSVVVGRLPRAC
jgi:hypothetical protein